MRPLNMQKYGNITLFHPFPHDSIQGGWQKQLHYIVGLYITHLKLGCSGVKSKSGLHIIKSYLERKFHKILKIIAIVFRQWKNFS